MIKERMSQIQINIIAIDKVLSQLLKTYNLDKTTLIPAKRLLRAILDCRNNRIHPGCTPCRGIYASITYGVGPSIGVNSENCNLNIGGSICDINKCKCNPQFTMAQTKKSERNKYCFRQLRAGKCTDEYMQRTLGITLFPDKYTKRR